MKRLLTTLLLVSVFTCFGTVYTTTAANTWDANGAPPAGWISNHTINVHHAITNMTAYTLQMFTNITVNIESGGDWQIAGITMNDGTSTVTVKSGGELHLSSTLSWSNSTLDVQSGGLLRTNGATAASGGTVTVNGTFFIDGAWTNNVAIGGSGLIRYTGTKSGTGSFTGGTEQLPVELLAFDGIRQENGVQLTWSTGSETESENFMIMRSTDGKIFTQIGELPAAGYSESLLNYSFFDPSPPSGDVYYKLHQKDFNGTINEHHIIRVYTKPINNVIVSTFPNPATNQLNVSFFSDEKQVKNYRLEIRDAQGKIVFENNITAFDGRNKLTLNVNNLSKGSYTVILSSALSVPSSVSFIKR